MTSIYALCGGMIELDRSGFFCDVAPGTRITIPVICFLIAHPRGHVLLDTGVHRQAVTDPVGRMGERRAKLFGLRGAPTDEVASQLALLGLGACRHPLRRELAPALRPLRRQRVLSDPLRLLVQRAEMDAARRVLRGETMKYNPSAIDFDHPLDYQLFDGEHDVFGDGQVVLLPTYGHTPGHQSLRVRAGKGSELILTADACYTRENMDRDVLPTVLWDPAEMSRSLGILRDWRDRKGATVIYGHDAAQWQDLRRAPAPLV